MAWEEIRINGRTYVSHDCWVFGDYGGAGDIGLANIRVLADECEGHLVECPMGDLRYVLEGCPYGLGEDTLREIQQERPWAIRTYGDYSSEQIWIRKPLAFRVSSHGFRGDTWAEQMDSYPCLSDEEAGKVTMEWEEEAWESWLKSDLIRSLPEDLREVAEGMDDSALREAYGQAMEETNTYPTPEYSGVHVDVERIAEAFADHVRDHAQA